MAENELSAQIRMEVGQVLGALDQLGNRLGRIQGQFAGAEKNAASFGTRVGVAAGVAGKVLEKVLDVATKVAAAVKDVDDRLIALNRRSGGSNVNLSASFANLAVKDIGSAIRVARTSTGVATQDQIDSFVAQLSTSETSLNDKQVRGLTRQFARGGSLLFGGGEGLAALTGAFGDLAPEDVADLAVQFKRSSGKSLSDAGVRGINQLTGLGVDRFKALALVSALASRGQQEGASGFASAIASGESLSDILQGNTSDVALQRVVAGLGPAAKTIDATAADFRGVTSRDVVGDELARIAGGSSAAARELSFRRDERQTEIQRNLASDADKGDAVIRKANLDELEDNMAQDGSVTSAIGRAALGGVRGVAGDRAATVVVDLSDKTLDKLNKNQSRSAGD